MPAPDMAEWLAQAPRPTVPRAMRQPRVATVPLSPQTMAELNAALEDDTSGDDGSDMFQAGHDNNP